MTKIIGYPFVAHVKQDERPEIENPNEWLKKNYINSDNVSRYGYYKLMGYQFNFRPYLKLYIYKQYEQWSEIYAPNKTMLRKKVYGKIDKIICLQRHK